MRSFTFEEGSYWIYSDSMSQKKDSTFVWESFEKNQFVGSSNDNATFQMYRMVFINLMGELALKVDLTGNDMHNDFPANLGKNIIFKKDSTLPNIKSHFRYKKYFPSFSTNKSTFKNVYCGEYDSLENSQSGTFKRFWIADSVGIIRYETYRNNIQTSVHILDKYSIRFYKLSL